MNDITTGLNPRPDDCLADVSKEYATCARCGLAWRVGFDAPKCAPMTIGRMRECVIAEINARRGSHAVLADLKREGVAADPIAPLTRAAELEGVLRFFDRVTTNDEAMDILNPNRRRRAST